MTPIGQTADRFFLCRFWGGEDKDAYGKTMEQTINEITGTIEAAIQKKALGEETVRRRKDELEQERDDVMRILQTVEAF
jgi:hypothetical protein